VNVRRLVVVAMVGLMGIAASGPATLASPHANRSHGGVATQSVIGRAAPYEYLGWGSPQKPTEVMKATGIRAFTLAFMLAKGGCHPAWDGSRPLTGGHDQAAIRSIRAAGGSVVVSFGGWSGAKLGVRCHTATALAAAYEQVIDTYALKAIDIDIEHTEMASGAVRQRVVNALIMMRQDEARPIAIYITLGVTMNGPDAPGHDLIRRAARAHLAVTGWTAMPFDFGAPVHHMGAVSLKAAEGLKRTLMANYHESADAAYRTMGISSMNGNTDEADESITVQDFHMMLAYARLHHLARFSFWAINRDRPCGHHGTADSCDGIARPQYTFTRIIAHFHG
jgi:chitinase